MTYHDRLYSCIYLSLIQFQLCLYLLIGKNRVATVNEHIMLCLFACSVAYISLCKEMLCTSDHSAVNKSLGVGC